MAKFTEENKEVQEFEDKNYFKYGVHTVKLALADLGETDGGKEYIEFHLVGENEEEDTARVWFTTPAAIKYSFNVIRQIIVHNAKTEAAKEKARKAVDAVKDTTELVDLLNTHCMGGECWFTKYPDPERTYQNAKGETKQSINKNVYGYKPTLKPELMPQDQKAVDPADYPDEPFADEPAKDASKTVPADDSWA